MSHSHIRFSVINENGVRVELIEPKHTVSIVYGPHDPRLTVVVDHGGIGKAWHPLEPYDYFLMELTGRSLPISPRGPEVDRGDLSQG